MIKKENKNLTKRQTEILKQSYKNFKDFVEQKPILEINEQKFMEHEEFLLEQL